MGYGINNFVNVLDDCQYSQDSTFGVIVSLMEKYASFGHLEGEYEMMAPAYKYKVWD